MAIASSSASLATRWIIKSFDEDVDYYVPVEEVENWKTAFEIKQAGLKNGCYFAQLPAHELRAHECRSMKVFRFLDLLLTTALSRAVYYLLPTLVNGTAGPTGKDFAVCLLKPIVKLSDLTYKSKLSPCTKYQKPGGYSWLALTWLFVQDLSRWKSYESIT